MEGKLCTSLHSSFYTNLALGSCAEVYQWGWSPHLRSLTQASRSKSRWGGTFFSKLQNLPLPAWLSHAHAHRCTLVHAGISLQPPDFNSDTTRAGKRIEHERYPTAAKLTNPTMGPTPIEELWPSVKIVQVAAGGEFSLCLSECGRVWSWGTGPCSARTRRDSRGVVGTQDTNQH